VRKLEPAHSGSFELSYGKAFHGLLEDDPGPNEELFGAKWSSVVRTHHACYEKNWAANEHWNYNVLQNEVPFSTELIPGVELHGYLDGIAELEGKNYIVETKTTGSDISKPDYWNWKVQDEQVGVYLLASKLSPELQSYNIEGVIYDVTRRPSIKQRKNEPDQKYVDRTGVWLYDNRKSAFIRKHMTRTAEQLDDLSSDIISLHEQTSCGNFLKNRSACYQFRKQCGFYKHCFENEPLTNTTLFQVRKRR